jgi:hypothetical protein
LVLRRSAMGQDLSPAMQSSLASEQSESIRTAASRFVRTLASKRQARIIYPFPSHQTPTMAKFAREGGPVGPPGRSGGPGNPGGPGGSGGPGGLGGFAFVGEKYGQAIWTNFPVSDVPGRGSEWAS